MNLQWLVQLCCLLWITSDIFPITLAFDLIPKKPAIHGNGLSDITDRVNPDGLISNYIFELADWNGDKYTDLICLDEDTVKVYLWSHEDWKFTVGPSLELSLGNSNKSIEYTNIRNVVARDFDWDGKVDLMVSLQTSSTAATCVVTAHIWRQVSTTQVEYMSSVGSSSSTSGVVTVDQALVGNIYGTGRMDLYGQDPANNMKRTFWRMTNAGKYIKRVHTSASLHGLGNQQIATSAVVDINGDCRSDLFVLSWQCSKQSTNNNNQRWACQTANCRDPMTATNKTLEFWLSISTTGVDNEPVLFSKSVVTFPGAGPVSWMDADGDGDMDIVMGVCEGKYCDLNFFNYLVIYYNQQEYCGGCCAENNFDFWQPTDLQNGFNLAELYKQTDLTGISVTLLDDSYLIPNSVGQPYPRRTPKKPFYLPPSLRVGDYTLDSFPDLIMATQSINDTTNDDTHHPSYTTTLFRNIPCEQCPKATKYLFQRRFTREIKKTEALTSLPNGTTPTTIAFFFALDEESSPDVVFMTQKSDGSFGGAKFIYNNYFNDAWFFRVLGLNGTPRPSKYDKSQPWGAAMPGATSKLRWADLNMHKRTTTGCQLTQSSYLSLETPYVMYGLGRTNDYIQDYWFGVHVADEGKPWRWWVALIPNAQVFVIPTPLQKKSEWQIQLYISPSTATMYVGIFLLVSLFVFSIPVGILQYRERKQDEEERHKAASFAF